MGDLPKEIKINTELAFNALSVLYGILNKPELETFLNEQERAVLNELTDCLLAKKYSIGDRLNYKAKLQSK